LKSSNAIELLILCMLLFKIRFKVLKALRAVVYDQAEMRAHLMLMLAT